MDLRLPIGIKNEIFTCLKANGQAFRLTITKQLSNKQLTLQLKNMEFARQLAAEQTYERFSTIMDKWGYTWEAL